MSTKTAPPRSGTATTLLACMFAVTGAIHFLRPGVFDPIVPRLLPGSSRSWTYASGLAEWALAGLVASRRTRSIGGLLSALFLVAVFPANIRTVRVVRSQPMAARVIAMVRLPLQLPLIALAVRVGRSDPPTT